MMEEKVVDMLPLKIKLGLRNSEPSTGTIFMVPDELRSLKDNAYNPHIVSIGPYYYLNGNLQDMNAHKLDYVLHLLHRTDNAVQTLDECGKAIQDLGDSVRACYAKDINHLEEEKLLEMLVVDGCFLIELFHRQVIKQDTSLNDPIADNAWMVSRLRHDLLLLGNQIPFFVIQKLYDTIKKQPQPPQPRPRFNIPPEYSLTSLALSFFLPRMDVKQERISPEPKHLLELLHVFWLLKSDQNRSGSGTRGFNLRASELIKTGIQFKKNDSGHLLDIKFNGKNGVIEIPPLSIDELESPLSNLIALEQYCSSPYHVTSYAFMMRSLIRSSVDAELLQRKGIIISDWKTGRDVSDLIRGICKNVVFSENFYFDELCKKVNEYRASRCQRQKAIWTFRYHRDLAELKRDYFSSTWKVIAFLAGLVLLILTGLQTFYTVRSYYPH